jgi:hypothetical protein
MASLVKWKVSKSRNQLQDHVYLGSIVCEMLPNKISKDHRFAKRENQEYHVFSTHVEDPSLIEDWVAISRPQHVLIDPNTYDQLRNKRIKWVFDDEDIIIGCSVIVSETTK